MPGDTPAVLELRLFGPPQLLRDGCVVHVGSRKAMWLLALLVLEDRQPRDQVAALLWPDIDPAAARRNLRRELFRLRERGCPLVESGAGLVLDPTMAIDVQRFRAALRDGDDAAALQLATDTPLQGLEGVAGTEADNRLGGWRHQLQQQHQGARLRHAQALERRGEPAAALALHQQALAFDPCAEEPARQAMRLLAARGERAAALALFARLEAALRAALDLTPDAQTQALAASLRQDEPPPPALTPAPMPRVAPLLADRLPFVGRTAARERIAAAWAAGRRVYLSGVPGVGKTRLATECMAEQGAWLRVCCTQDDAELPYAAAVRALRALHEAAPDVVLPSWVRRELAALLPELGDAPVALATAEAAERLRAAFATAWSLLVRDNFNALLIDDWQWGDPTSIDLWNRLDDAQAPVRWIVAHRSAQLPAAALQRMRSDVDSGRAVAIELDGLDADEALALVRALSRSPGGSLFARRLQRATAGNPFFLIETLRSLYEQGQLQEATDGTWSTPFDEATRDYAELPVPASVRDAVLGRVRALGDPAQRLLEAASLAGDRFDLALLEGVTSLTPGQAVAVVEHAQAARLLQPDATGYRFAHDLVRQCLADSLSPARRRLLHKVLAQRLAACDAAPALVALQHERAGHTALAVTWRLRAAEAAWRLHALPEVRQHADRALAAGARGKQAVEVQLLLLRLHRRQADSAGASAALSAAAQAAHDTDPDTRLDIRLTCAEDCCNHDRTDEGLALLDALQADLAAAPVLQRVRALTLRARVCGWRRQHDESAALRRSAIDLLDGVPDALLVQAELLDDAARAAMRQGALADGELLARRAVASFEAAGHEAGLAGALTMLGAFALHGRNDRAVAEAALERSRALAAHCGHVPAQRAAILNLIKLHTDAGRVDAALALLDQGEGLAPAFEHQRAEQAFLQARYFVHYLRGEVAAADAAAGRLLAMARQVPERAILVESLQMVVDLYLHAGQLDRAGTLLDEAEAAIAQAGTTGGLMVQPVVAAKRAWWCLASGDVAAAQRQLDRVGAPAREEDRWLLGWIGAAIALAVGDTGAATRWLEGLDLETEVATDVLAMVLVQRLALARRKGDADPVAGEHARALLRSGQVPVLEAARLRAVLGPD